jgi:Phosphoserine phosphatase RsbU, N-terminal domain
MTPIERLTRNYRAAFLRYLPRRDEAALTAGYELGRSAVTEGISMLELVRVHHEVFLEVLHDTADDELTDVGTAASQFFTEVLATFDMAQRRFLDGTRAGAPPGG